MTSACPDVDPDGQEDPATLADPPPSDPPAATYGGARLWTDYVSGGLRLDVARASGPDTLIEAITRWIPPGAQLVAAGLMGLDVTLEWQLPRAALPVPDETSSCPEHTTTTRS